MKVISSLDTPLPALSHPIALTIGNYDGVHLGHQAILKRMQSTPTKVVISFSNHPVEVLKPEVKLKRICSIEHKIRLLETFNIDFLYLIPFTLTFSQQTPEQFLLQVRKSIPFDLLILGQDAKIGKDRMGTQTIVKSIGNALGFEVEYVEDLLIEGKRLSSSHIRDLIQEGKISELKSLLGRPYSFLWGHTDGLTLPPPGTYSVNPGEQLTIQDTLHLSSPVNLGKEIIFTP